MSYPNRAQAEYNRSRANHGHERAHSVILSLAPQRRRSAILGVALTSVFTLLPWPAVADLSPAIQADLYLVQAEDYIQQKDYASAQEAMGKILALQEKHDLPIQPVFHFRYATVLDLAGAYEEAIV